MKRYRTLALVAVVVLTGASVLIVLNASDDTQERRIGISDNERSSTPPDVTVDPATSSVQISAAPSPKRASASVVAPESAEKDQPAGDLPGSQTGGYELAEPGDRTPAPPPEFFRALAGAFDDSSGAPLFASHCPYSHSRPDDPMVYPGRPGASHLHDFFGNKQTDAHSTDDSLRDYGQTTCTNFKGDSAAYWVPALYEHGQRVVPTMLTAYYTPGSKDHRTVEPHPRGLKVLLKDPEASKWYCAGQGTGPASDEPPMCPSGQHLVLQLVFPDCWDGKYLDVPNHHDHMEYAVGMSCPKTHSVPVPQLVLFIDYMNARGGQVDLAPLDDPSAPHADFVNSWDQGMLTKFVRDCINSGVHCGSRSP